MKLYSYSSECTLIAESRWLSLRFVIVSIAAGIILFRILQIGTPWTFDFQPGRTERLRDENVLMADQLLTASRLMIHRQSQLLQLQEQHGVLNNLLHDRSMYGDPAINNIVSLTAIQKHAFAPMNYFQFVRDRSAASLNQ